MRFILAVFFVHFFNSTFAERTNGNVCTTPNGELATCISIYKCSILLNTITKEDATNEQKKFVRDSKCELEKETFVCCGTQNGYVNITGRFNENLPDKTVCGIQLTFKIFDGKIMALEEFPWLALIQVENSLGLTYPLCGGTLISNRYVLTAAHCVTDRKFKNNPTIRLGEYNLNTLVDCIHHQAGFAICNDEPVDVGIEKTMYHESFDLSKRIHDIALIRLNKTIKYTDFIRPICLPEMSDFSTTNNKLTVAGWGRTETARISALKLKVKVPLVDNSICSSIYQNISKNIIVNHGHVCAGGKQGSDSCQGDSGGPLMFTTKRDVTQWYIEGIVSYGHRSCGTEGIPAVYTRVFAYLDWIMERIEP